MPRIACADDTPGSPGCAATRRRPAAWHRQGRKCSAEWPYEKMAAAALGQVGLATSVASDFASGNLGQGLVDSLNLYLPQVAAAYLKSQNNQSNLANVVNADATAASLSGSSDTPAPGTFVGVVSASQVNPADAVSLTTTVGGVTQTTEIAPIGTGSASGSIGIAVQPGVPGTGSATQTGTGGGTVDLDLGEITVTAPRPSADTTTPTFGDLLLQALQFIPAAEAASIVRPSPPAIQAANLALAQKTFDDPKVKAFLHTIASIEGPTYNALYSPNGKPNTFSDFSKHPAPVITADGKSHSAAGAYQITQGTWDGLSSQLGLSDFSMQTQDLMATQILINKHVVGLIDSDNLNGAVAALNRTWTSLPGGSETHITSDQFQSTYNALLKSP